MAAASRAPSPPRWRCADGREQCWLQGWLLHRLLVTGCALELLRWKALKLKLRLLRWCLLLLLCLHLVQKEGLCVVRCRCLLWRTVRGPVPKGVPPWCRRLVLGAQVHHFPACGPLATRTAKLCGEEVPCGAHAACPF